MSATRTLDTATPPASTPAADPGLSHREILEILAGLLAALFTAVLSSTIVSNALPTIIADLEGSQTQYTWVITASLLAMTVSTPVWGKLSDLISKKLLVQLAIVMFVAGSALAGAAHNVPFLIGARVLQGLAMGGPDGPRPGRDRAPPRRAAETHAPPTVSRWSGELDWPDTVRMRPNDLLAMRGRLACIALSGGPLRHRDSR